VKAIISAIKSLEGLTIFNNSRFEFLAQRLIRFRRRSNLPKCNYRVALMKSLYNSPPTHRRLTGRTRASMRPRELSRFS
jgi:hypothetical protein